MDPKYLIKEGNNKGLSGCRFINKWFLLLVVLVPGDLAGGHGTTWHYTTSHRIIMGQQQGERGGGWG